mmetsp:Transcript_68280/g.191299  ORF Transcript_68280/g.191299 Transcript_68280/m.191299 type:complete len:258 (-) Transcript_68280:105-878(-)
MRMLWSSSVSGWAVRLQMGHCVMRYSPGWCAMGPRTKHFQQNRWLQSSSTMSVSVSKQMGHCCDGCASDKQLGSCPLKSNSQSMSIWPKDSTAACSSAKSEPLKKVCRANQPARSDARSSRPKQVSFRRFLRILTTATAFHTAYFRRLSTSPRMRTRVLKALEHRTNGDAGNSSASSSPSSGGSSASEQRLRRLCSDSESWAVRSRSSRCLVAKQAFTELISLMSDSSKPELPVRASAKSPSMLRATTSLICFFKCL